MVQQSSHSSSLSSYNSNPSSRNPSPSPSRTVSPALSPSRGSPPPISSNQQSRKLANSSLAWSTKKAAGSIGKYRRDASRNSHKVRMLLCYLSSSISTYLLKLSSELSRSKKEDQSLSKDSKSSEKLRRSTRPKVTYEDALAEAVAGMRKKKASSSEKVCSAFYYQSS